MSLLPSCHGDGRGFEDEEQNSHSSHKQHGSQRHSGQDSTNSNHQNCDSTVDSNHHDDQDCASDSNISGDGALVVAEGPSKRDLRADKIRMMEVCREFLHKRCRRTELQCKYAHPPSHVEISDGHVTCCYDFSKGRCRRVNPPCRYYHPPTSAISPAGGGRIQPAAPTNQGLPINVLPPYLVNAIAAYTASLQQQMLQQQLQLFQQRACLLPGGAGALSPPPGATYSSGATSTGSMMTPRDRIEVCREFKHSRCQRAECRYAHPPDWMTADVNNCVKVCVDYVNGKCERETCRYYHPPAHLAQRILSQLRNSSRKGNFTDNSRQPRVAYHVE